MATFYVMKGEEKVKVTGYETPSKATRLCPDCYWGDEPDPANDTSGWTPVTTTITCKYCGKTNEAN